jgi:alpha-galactosidase
MLAILDEYNKRDASLDKIEYKIRDVWQHKDLNTTKNNFSSVIESHDVTTLVLTKIKP